MLNRDRVKGAAVEYYWANFQHVERGATDLFFFHAGRRTRARSVSSLWRPGEILKSWPCETPFSALLGTNFAGSPIKIFFLGPPLGSNIFPRSSPQLKFFFLGPPPSDDRPSPPLNIDQSLSKRLYNGGGHNICSWKSIPGTQVTDTPEVLSSRSELFLWPTTLR